MRLSPTPGRVVYNSTAAELYTILLSGTCIQFFYSNIVYNSTAADLD